MAIGQRIRIDVTPHEIVGVMPAGFWFPSRGTDVWLPLRVGDHETVDVAGRLSPGRRWADVQSEFDVLAARGTTGMDRTNARALVRSLSAEAQIRIGPGVAGLVAPALAILLIACANVGNLLIMRVLGRERELAVRAALGATAGRLARLSLVETAIVGAGAGVAGALLAVWSMTGLQVAMASAIPAMAGSLRVGWLVVALAACATMVTVAGTGVLPAVSAARRDLSASLAASRGRRLSSRLRYGAGDLLVVLQVALAVVLVLVSVFQVRFIDEIVAAERLPSADRDLVAAVTTAQSLSHEARGDVLQRVLEEASAVPGIDAIALASGIPVRRGQALSDIAVSQNGATACRAKIVFVTPRYFDALGLTFQRGGLPSGFGAVASVTAATRCLNASSDEAWQIRVKSKPPAGPAWIRVTGVVADPFAKRTLDLGESASYIWILGAREWPAEVYLIARPAPGVDRAAPALAAAVARAPSDVAMETPATLDDRVGAALAPTRFVVGVLGAVALLALLLAFTGVYAALSQSCEHRIVELGIRLALGANPRRLVAAAVARDAPLVAAGLVVGLVGTVWVTAIVWRDLLVVNALDPRAWMSVAGVLSAAAFLASLGPALRAVRVDPMAVLRSE